jgi:cysteinyl-tRNA synthetase
MLLFSTHWFCCSAAHNNCDDWARYWIHTGHLHIDGLKMSKSLKNFISIKDYLKNGWTSMPADDLRLYFLHHKYHSTLHFSRKRIEEAAMFRQRIEIFFAFVKKSKSSDAQRLAVRSAPEGAELKQLRQRLLACKGEVSAALRDDFNTPEAVRLLAELVAAAVPCIRGALADNTLPVQPVYAVHKYVKTMLRTFGLTFIEVSVFRSFDWRDIAVLCIM